MTYIWMIISWGFRLAFSGVLFFFQAEDGIRDKLVTGVQTCALPISPPGRRRAHRRTPCSVWCPAPRPPTRAVESRGFWSSGREKIPKDTVGRVQHCKRRAAWWIGLGEIGPHQARSARLLPSGQRHDYHDGIERPERSDADRKDNTSCHASALAGRSARASTCQT